MNLGEPATGQDFAYATLIKAKFGSDFMLPEVCIKCATLDLCSQLDSQRWTCTAAPTHDHFLLGGGVLITCFSVVFGCDRANFSVTY